MKKIKIILRDAVVLLIATALLLSTVVTGNTIEEKNEVMNPAFLKIDNRNPIVKIEQPTRDSVLFSQLPYEPYEQWIFMTSASDSGYRVHDNYWDVNESICDIHWWGLSLIYTGSGWQDCDPEEMCFEIIFWDSLLGNKICEYTQICPNAIPTGKFYSSYEMYYWQTALDPCCDQIENGWVSIQSISSSNDCWFLWAGSDDGDAYSYQEGSPDPEDFINDTAFELTKAGPPPVPKICCAAVGMHFGDVDPGQDVTAQIKVCNCGDPMSFLNWHVDTTNLPTWGTWKFIPESGTDLLEPNCAIIDVECTVTEEEGEYTGTIKIYNSDNSSDFCEIYTSVSVIGPGPPPTAPTIDGQTSGKAGVEYEYTFNSEDPDGDSISYFVDWGDNSSIGWTAFYASGADVKIKHTWSEQGTYKIIAKAKNVDGLISPEGTLTVNMPRNKALIFNFNLLSWLFERFPLLERLFSLIK